ncbi:Major Facilitator Superfamily protein [Marininema mesophilum]|uniref:Major Facilitator Superfamily protein n=1 Tax=Marininema mesophilum TaxID=1048340 RepID=A0A1H2QFQ8_9BACL|nr:MFS transporter [Marininema mesophilum]SDW05972.1 Major Facilitator Superfamily protein [Marininema mesophilum]
MLSKKNPTLDAFIIAIFLSALDIGVLAPALTVIALDLEIPIRAVFWVIALHLAVFVLALPLMEAWGAKAGKRGWFLASLLVYAAASLIAGDSKGLLTLIIGRVVQAMAAGGIVPILSEELGRMLKWQSRKWRWTVQGILAALLILTPFLSSTLTWYLNWRWLFWINIPAVLVVFVISFRFRSTGRLRTPTHHIHGVMYFGVILLSMMMAIAQFNPSKGWAALVDPSFLPFAILSLGLGVLMMMVENVSDRPFFSMQLFTDRRLMLLHGVMVLSGITWSAIVLVPGWMAEVYQHPTGTGGIFLTVVACSAWLALPLAQRVSLHWGYRGVLIIGFFALASSYFTLAFALEPVVLTSILVVLGFGMSFTLIAPVHELVFEVISYRQMKKGVMAIGMFRAAGTALGLIAMGLSFFAATPMITASTTMDVVGIPQLWKHSYQMGMLIAGSSAVLGFILALWLPVPQKELVKEKNG